MSSMIIQCPSCHTNYKVSDDVVTTSNPTFRCSRCKHIFVSRLQREADAVQETQEDVSPSSLTRGKEEDVNREMSFSFPPPEKEKIGEETDEGIFTSSATEEQSSPATDPPFTIPKEDFSLNTDASMRKDRTFEENWQVSSPPPKTEVFSSLPEGKPISTGRCLTFFSVLLIIYSLLTWMHQLQPASIETILKATPWLGSVVFNNDHLSQGMILESLHPSFQTISGNQEVLVISGAAINRNPVSVREVRVEGHIYDTAGKEIDRQVVWVGSALSPKIIRNLTDKEILILQKLSPAISFEIAPQESATFVIVFLRSKGEIKDFSCRILSAEEAV